MSSISIQNITKTYGTIKGVEDISFSVDHGELFGLIGPDGAGKTTLFKILTTLLIPDSGTASVEGLDTVKDYKKIRKIIGYMPGRFSLYQDLSVQENLEFFATIFGTTLGKNHHLIEDIYVQLEPFRKRAAGKLSGGMKQKLALCCALIHEPKVLFLDEPTTGVDAVSRSEFWEMLNRLRKRGITILVSTPYMDEASLCERIALTQNGNIMKIDTPKGIVNSYGKPLFAVYSNDARKLIADLREQPFANRVESFGDSLHLTTAEHVHQSDIERVLIEKGHRNIEIKQIEASIEDVFLDLM